jgi:hypothetical protein
MGHGVGAGMDVDGEKVRTETRKGNDGEVGEKGCGVMQRRLRTRMMP